MIDQQRPVCVINLAPPMSRKIRAREKRAAAHRKCRTQGFLLLASPEVRAVTEYRLFLGMPAIAPAILLEQLTQC